jgi:pyranose oxidase
MRKARKNAVKEGGYYLTNENASELNVDVLIVGSGPIGATFARVISESVPTAMILMIDLGPQLTCRPGMHVKNIKGEGERLLAQIHSQGPEQYRYEIPKSWERLNATGRRGKERVATLATPGTHLASPDDVDLDRSGMPAAALSSNIGGMGVHWTCACPAPCNTERIPFISENEWNSLFAKARKLLCVTQEAYPDSLEAFAILQTLGEAFNARLPEGRQVQHMPLAVRLDEHNHRYWVGPDVILGPLADAAEGLKHEQRFFELRSETICRWLTYDGDRVSGAVIEHLPSGRRERVSASVVVVAADALRTPQLLWASSIRPSALGHYLNDHTQIMTSVELSEEILQRTRATLQAADQFPEERRELVEPIIGVFWVPFHDPEHPFHGQVMHLALSPIPLEQSRSRAAPRHVVGLTWCCRKEIRYEDSLEFSDGETDSFGMPKMTIHYELTAKDRVEIAAAQKDLAHVVAAFGKELNEGESRLRPPGSSLHYQGTVRMGETDNAYSVCDPYSRVWGFENLFVGGNGVIPTATACNPTATSVALAIRACERIVPLIRS